MVAMIAETDLSSSGTPAHPLTGTDPSVEKSPVKHPRCAACGRFAKRSSLDFLGSDLVHRNPKKCDTTKGGS